MIHVLTVLGWIAAVVLVLLSLRGLHLVHKIYGFDFGQQVSDYHGQPIRVKHFYLLQLFALALGVFLWWVVL